MLYYRSMVIEVKIEIEVEIENFTRAQFTKNALFKD